MGSHSQRLSMEHGLLLTTLLHSCTAHPFLLDLFRPRQSSDRSDSDHHAPAPGDSYGVPVVEEEYHAPTTGDSYGVPHGSPCPTYTTTTTTPPPTYHQSHKAKAPFPDVLGFIKSIPEGIHNLFRPSAKPHDDYGVPCTIQESSYKAPEVAEYTAPEVAGYTSPEEHGDDLSINER